MAGLDSLERATKRLEKAKQQGKTGKLDRVRGIAVHSPAVPAPKIKGLEMIQMDVTPEMAAQWLEGKCPNRTVSEVLVNKFARDMANGAWHLNGETVVFDTNEALLDGQHRLWAIVISGITVRMCVVKGADPSSMETFDTGRSRSFSDVLKIKGDSTAPKLASAAARWWRWYDNFRQGHLTHGGTPSHDELKLSYENHPSIESALGIITAHGKGHKRSVVVPAGILTFALSGALEANEQKAEQWFVQLLTGEGLKMHDPAWTLRERMIADKSSLRRMDSMTVCAYTVKSWNAHYRGRDLKHLKWGVNKGGDMEAFPEFEGRNNNTLPKKV